MPGTVVRIGLGLVGLALVGVVAGCSSSRAGPAVPPYSHDPGHAVLRLLTHNGYLESGIDPEDTIPVITVYGDGLVLSWDRYTRNPSGAAFIRQRHLSRVQVDELMAAAAPLQSPHFDLGHLRPDGAGDPSDTYVQVLTDAGTTVVSTVTLLHSGGPVVDSPDRRRDRQEFDDLSSALNDLAGGAPYLSDELAVVLVPADPLLDRAARQEWPFVAPDQSPAGPRSVCQPMDRATVEAAIGAGHEPHDVVWMVNGQPYLAYFRAVLPEDTACGTIPSATALGFG